MVTNIILQVESAEFDCKEGSFDDLCNYCLPPDCTYEEYIYWMTQGVNFTTFYKQLFWYESVLQSFSLLKVWFCIFLGQEYWRKS